MKTSKIKYTVIATIKRRRGVSFFTNKKEAVAFAMGLREAGIKKVGVRKGRAL